MNDDMIVYTIFSNSKHFTFRSRSLISVSPKVSRLWTLGQLWQWRWGIQSACSQYWETCWLCSGLQCWKRPPACQQCPLPPPAALSSRLWQSQPFNKRKHKLYRIRNASSRAQTVMAYFGYFLWFLGTITPRLNKVTEPSHIQGSLQIFWVSVL